MTISKTKIRNLGEKIRASQYAVNSDTIIELEAYRVSHKVALADTYNLIYDMSIRIYKNAIVAYRIKRIESIISKLKRIPTMKLNTMGDIAGCRCIFNSNKQLYKLKDEIQKSFEVIKVKDYLEKPQLDGYRSIHMYVKIPSSSNIVEIQLRNKVDHNWATLNEITDLLFDENLKDKTSDSRLRELHLLFSKRENLEISDKRRIIQLIRRYRFFEKLSGVFARNYIKIRKQWTSLEDMPDNSFILIEASKDKVPKIDVFSSFDQAEKEYFGRFSGDSTSNRVLTHIPHPTYKKLSIAYSNYILTYHQFIDDCFNILKTLILNSISKRKFVQFRFYFNYYIYINAHHVKNIQTELKEYQLEKNAHSRSNKEWYNDIVEELEKRKKQNVDLIKKMEREIPQSIFIHLLFTVLYKSAIIKYEKLLRN